MFSCCCFCSGKFKSPRTEHLSRPPLLPPLPSESSYLLSCIILLLLPHIASFFKSLLSSQRSRTSLVTLTSLRIDLTHRKKQLVKLTNSFYFVFKNIRGSIRGGGNTTPLGGSLPRRTQRPGRKNSLSQWPCVRDHSDPYSNLGFRLWSI